MLQQEGPMRLTDVAGRLEVSRSTAHRLLSMLVYHDFAEQLPDRLYSPGSVLRTTGRTDAPLTELRRLGQP
jgi:IclR family acetate operon transcriptional repressor